MDIREVRRRLHGMAELSGEEQQTADYLASILNPNKLIKGLGGHGLAAVYQGNRQGKTVLLRAELDAVPDRDGRPAHTCGHDGHMAILAGLGERLEQGDFPGRVILLFQPSEETGQGAKLVLGSENWGDLEPDIVLAIHNIPGHGTGQVLLREGLFAYSSTGCVITLEGETAHASEPEKGKSPAAAMARMRAPHPKGRGIPLGSPAG